MMSATSHACRACRRGCREDDTTKLLSWNLRLKLVLDKVGYLSFYQQLAGGQPFQRATVTVFCKPTWPHGLACTLKNKYMMVTPIDSTTLLHAKSTLSCRTPSVLRLYKHCERYLQHTTAAMSVISTLRACWCSDFTWLFTCLTRHTYYTSTIHTILHYSS